MAPERDTRITPERLAWFDRLPAAEREAFIARFGTTLHVAHGTVMKEYVTVPDDLFADPVLLAPFFRASHASVAGLRPKATKRSP